MTSKRSNRINLSIFWRALLIFPFTTIACIALAVLFGLAFREEGSSYSMIGSMIEGGMIGLVAGGIFYIIVVVFVIVLRVLTNRCGIVLQEIIFMTVGAGIGWVIGSGFEIIRISFTAFLGLIFGALLGALLKISTDNKLE
jgi:hypothetical protein